MKFPPHNGNFFPARSMTSSNIAAKISQEAKSAPAALRAATTGHLSVHHKEMWSRYRCHVRQGVAGAAPCCLHQGRGGGDGGGDGGGGIFLTRAREERIRLPMGLLFPKHFLGGFRHVEGGTHLIFAVLFDEQTY